MYVENIKESFQSMKGFDLIPFYIMLNTSHNAS